MSSKKVRLIWTLLGHKCCSSIPIRVTAYLQLMCLKTLVCSLKIMFAVSFANNVVLRPPLFAVNVVSKSPCLRFEAFMFAVRYK
jgi:hypothetical protein